MKELKITVQTDAYIYTHGEINANTQYCWVVLHGYGQLASNIIRKFEHLGSENFVIAPEGLSHFYWSMQKSIVGASWMTKMHRLDEIARFSEYLQTVYNMLVAPLPETVRIIWVGFSQGGTTLMRLLHHAILRGVDLRVDEMLLWGAGIPEDIDYQIFANFFDTHFSEKTGKTMHYFVGNEDEFISLSRLEVLEKFVYTHQIPMKIHLFEGKHEILVPELEKWRNGYLF
jgi:predicted esterase